MKQFVLNLPLKFMSFPIALENCENCVVNLDTIHSGLILISSVRL